jgi:hypothetical protein
MHRAFHTENSDFSQFISTLDNYENPLASATDRALIDEVVRTTTGLKDIFPGFQQCISLPPEEQLALSKSFNNLMRDEILPLNEEIFGQQQRSFRYEADRKYCGALGEYTENSLERRKWINSERDRVRAKLRNPNYSVATEKIREQKQALENRFVQKLVPQYIEHIVGRNIKTIHYFEEKFKEFKKTEERINGYDPRVLIAEMNRTMDHLSLAFDQTRTFNRYCEYMRYLLVTTPKTESLCAQNKKTLQGHYSEIAALDTDIAQRIVDANLWEKTPVVYQTSRVSEYANHIKSWNDRGESKWYLKFDSRCSRLTKIKD